MISGLSDDWECAVIRETVDLRLAFAQQGLRIAGPSPARSLPRDAFQYFPEGSLAFVRELV